MRLLANENVSRSLIDALRLAGHDVAWIRKRAPGSADAAVMLMAEVEGRILLTYDRDFGELARQSHLPPQVGIVYLRLSPVNPAAVIARVLREFEQPRQWEGHFVVIEPQRTRVRSLASWS